MDLTARLDAMEAAIKKPSFRQSSGKANANHTEHMLLLKYANKKDRIGSRTGSLSCLFLLSRGDVVNGTKLLKQRIKALVDVLLCIP